MTNYDEALEPAREQDGTAANTGEASSSSQIADLSFMKELAIPLSMLACMVLAGTLFHVLGGR